MSRATHYVCNCVYLRMNTTNKHSLFITPTVNVNSMSFSFLLSWFNKFAHFYEAWLYLWHLLHCLLFARHLRSRWLYPHLTTWLLAETVRCLPTFWLFSPWILTSSSYTQARANRLNLVTKLSNISLFPWTFAYFQEQHLLYFLRHLKKIKEH